MIEEIWKPLLEVEGYEISNLAQIRSVDREVRTISNKLYKYKGQILKQTKDVNGRLCVVIRINRKTNIFRVHNLVGKYFIDNPNNYPCVLHKDDNCLNNSLDNLYWGTYKMNMADKTVNKKWYGDNHQNSKITVEQANEIRELLKEGNLNQTEIGNRYGITQAMVSLIKKGNARKFDNL